MTGFELIQAFVSKGFTFDKDVLFNYYVSLKTKPFVILTGISGSGKSKIAEVFAECLSPDEKNYEIIPVKPNWRDNKGLFGYHNVIDDNYYVTPLVKLFLKALKNPDKPYFIILDEMNIAKVEHYFADYLSLIESRRLVDDPQSSACFDDFSFDTNNSLSEALVLSAIDLGVDGVDRDISEFRNNRFSRKWKELIFTGQDTSWTPQVRTELNQKNADGSPARLAGRLFVGGGGRYHLKDRSEITDDRDARKYDELLALYQELTTTNKSIVQDNIQLHNDTVCIAGGTVGKCNCANCPYTRSEKYKCDKLWESDDSEVLIPPEIPIPLNVYTVGTVNVDETTYMFSPKVLDRSNVIEFNEIDFGRAYELAPSLLRYFTYIKYFYEDDYYFSDDVDVTQELKVSIPSVSDVNRLANRFPNAFETFAKVFSELGKYNMQFGYRVMNEMSAYVMNAATLSDNEAVIEHAIDYQINQKILPKMHGSYEKLWGPLTALLNCLRDDSVSAFDADNISDLESSLGTELDNTNLVLSGITEGELRRLFKCPKSASKILDMLIDLDAQGFTTYIR